MTKKDYVAIAEVIKLFDTKREIILGLSAYFMIDNPRFSPDKFFTACGIEKIPIVIEYK